MGNDSIRNGREPNESNDQEGGNDPARGRQHGAYADPSILKISGDGEQSASGMGKQTLSPLGWECIPMELH